jgi:hypothetical protein
MLLLDQLGCRTHNTIVPDLQSVDEARLFASKGVFLSSLICLGVESMQLGDAEHPDMLNIACQGLTQLDACATSAQGLLDTCGC